MASTFLRESVSANGNKKKWTISVWVKRSGLGANTIMSAWYADSTSGHMSFGFDSEDRLDLSTWSTNVLTTNRKFRDTNAWYHIQVAVDTDESTADNRARLQSMAQLSKFSQEAQMAVLRANNKSKAYRLQAFGTMLNAGYNTSKVV